MKFVSFNQYHTFQLVLEYGHEEQQTGAHNHEEDSEDESFIQRVTIRAGNNLYRHHHSPPIPHPPHHSHHSEPGGSGWRISPIPWRMMIPEENTKNRLSNEAIDEDDESTAIVELYNIRKSIEIHHV